MTEALWAIWTYAFSTPERATATFTAVLAISTILLWLSTRKLWKVTGIAAGHIPQVERAHVSGGAVRLTNDPHQFMVTINNYGKTPAFIGTIWAEIVPESTLPAVPVYEERQLGKFGGQVLPPGVMGCLAGMRHWNGNAGHVIYGRIWYRDIFKQYHSGGFILRIPDLVAVENRDAYWEDRPELDLGPAVRPT